MQFEVKPSLARSLKVRRTICRVREEMDAAHEAHVVYLARLEALCNKFPHVRQFVEKRCAPRTHDISPLFFVSAGVAMLTPRFRAIA